MSFALLFLCTGNRCRSPFAAALMEQRLGDHDVIVRSAGLLPGGEATPAEGIRVGSEYRIDLTPHVSRHFTRELADDADLVLTMTNSEAREVVTSHPDSWPRVFTVKSFVRWLGGQDVPAAGVSRSWLEQAGAPRTPHELLGAHADDEVEDPFGRSARTWRRVATELSDAVDRVVAAMPVRSGLPVR
ncbi:hypothetical protein ACFOYW_09870 [Gryllotalpicola reticulitermitis]|uniref:Phosphotyrosine protein phosphatase I domain-containing protein n=1 Tax=Gryllotalpicola reticulitermitis TaxID=1184153 RepID=A0ABV8Q887_9MICO